MGFKTKAYAKVKNTRVDPYGGHDIQITISKKKENGEFELTFSGWCRLFSKAVEKMPKVGDIIQILECDVTNAYVKGGQVLYNKSPRYVIYDHTFPNATVSRAEEQAVETVYSPIDSFEEVVFDDIPF